MVQLWQLPMHADSSSHTQGGAAAVGPTYHRGNRGGCDLYQPVVGDVVQHSIHASQQQERHDNPNAFRSPAHSPTASSGTVQAKLLDEGAWVAQAQSADTRCRQSRSNYKLQQRQWLRHEDNSMAF